MCVWCYCVVRDDMGVVTSCSNALLVQMPELHCCNFFGIWFSTIPESTGGGGGGGNQGSLSQAPA